MNWKWIHHYSASITFPGMITTVILYLLVASVTNIKCLHPSVFEFLVNHVQNASSLSTMILSTWIPLEDWRTLVFSKTKLSQTWHPNIISARDIWQSLSGVFLRWIIALKKPSLSRLYDALTLNLSKCLACLTATYVLPFDLG